MTDRPARFSADQVIDSDYRRRYTARMTRKQKTYSAKEAAALTGYCHSMLCRICQNSGGKIGSAVHISEVGQTVWRLSSKDISTLKHRKTLSLAEKRGTK